MNPKTETLDLEFHIEKPPEAVRAWWTDLPDDYRAEDPREQPYRIRTVRRFDNGRELHTFWRMPDGGEFDMTEVLRLQGNDRWTFDTPQALGYAIHDEFRAEPEGDGTLLHVHSTVRQASERPAVPLEGMKEAMRQTWAASAEICERDA